MKSSPEMKSSRSCSGHESPRSGKPGIPGPWPAPTRAWDLFLKAFALVIDDEEMLRSRIAGRSEDGYGNNTHELEALLQWQQTAAEDYRKLGAVIIDATQPLEKVVDAIVAQVIESKNQG